MKLAEALAIRKDTQKRIEQLKSRILNNVRVQEGDSPSEEPKELMKEMDACLNTLFALIFKINKTNMNTISEGRTITEMMQNVIFFLCVLRHSEKYSIKHQNLRSVIAVLKLKW